MDDLIYFSVLEIARLISEKKMSAMEVLDIHLKHIAKYNSKINAIILLDEEGAIKRAKEADQALSKGEIWGPLHGVPFTVKDSYATKGLRSSFGNPLHKNNIPDSDSTLVARLKQAGAILLGKTNLPYFSFDWQVNGSLFGRANNPYNLAHIVGGSSGGSAAALAAGFTPLCLGSDIAGSLRVPAHFCGITTIRPTEHALSDFGHFMIPNDPKVGRYMVTCGPMARKIQDLKLVYPLLWGADDKNWTIAPVELKNSPTVNTLKNLKVAYSKTLGNIAICQDTKKAFEKLLAKLSNAGCIIEETQPKDFDVDYMQEIWGIICGANDFRAALPNFIPKLLPKLLLKSQFPKTKFLNALIKGIDSSSRDLMFALEKRDILIGSANEFFSKYDVWLTPVAARPAFKHCKTGAAVEVENQKIPYSDIFSPFNCPTTLLANPIAVIPIAFSQEGLPIGIQIHSKRWQDWRLLEIAELIESLTEGFQKPKLYE
ncbi:MAG: amidase [Acidobacteria bacterium]|nr:amidase [Acidobacteriota bacterium]